MLRQSPCVAVLMTEVSKHRDFRTHRVSGWRLIGLYLYCLLLTMLAAALAGIIATGPHWLAGLIR